MKTKQACGQETCHNAATHKYVWPGKGERQAVCLACLGKLLQVAGVLGVFLDLQPISSEVSDKDSEQERSVKKDQKGQKLVQLRASSDDVHGALVTLSQHLDKPGVRAVILLVFNDEDDMVYRSDHGAITNPELAFAGTELIGAAHGWARISDLGEK